MGNDMLLKAPFPWFGGKSKVAKIVWPRFGDTLNYVEPFAGRERPFQQQCQTTRTETVNDADTYLANFWRATQADSDGVAHYADWPVNEADLHARHLWLVNQVDFRERMMTEPDFYDVKIAGWWVWGLSAWIGSGWCDVSRKPSPRMPMIGTRPTSGGVHTETVMQQIPALNGSQGVHGQGMTRNGRSRPNLRPQQGTNSISGISAFMQRLQDRLRPTRVVCGDWKRITGPSVTYKIGTTAVFLDPPYGDTRVDGLYAVDSLTVADEVRAWCMETIEDGKFTGPRYAHPKLRIALCGLDGEHNELEELGWDVVAWKANGGYGNQGKSKAKNAARERIWFSPHCLDHDFSKGIVDKRIYDDLPLLGAC